MGQIGPLVRQLWLIETLELSRNCKRPKWVLNFYSRIRADGSNELQIGTKLRWVVMDSQKNFEADPARRLGIMPFYVTRIRTAMGKLCQAIFWECCDDGLQSCMCGCVVRSGGQLCPYLVEMEEEQTHPHTPGLWLDCWLRLSVLDLAVFWGSS